MHTGCWYLQELLVPEMRTRILDKSVALLAPLVNTGHIDCIAVTGVSGLLYGIGLADRLGLPLTVVRKPHDSDHANHSGYRVEGEIHMKNYLIADDCIFTGATAVSIIQEIACLQTKKGIEHARCYGIILANSGGVEVHEFAWLYRVCGQTQRNTLDQLMWVKAEQAKKGRRLRE